MTSATCWMPVSTVNDGCECYTDPKALSFGPVILGITDGCPPSPLCVFEGYRHPTRGEVGQVHVYKGPQIFLALLNRESGAASGQAENSLLRRGLSRLSSSNLVIVLMLS